MEVFKLNDLNFSNTYFISYKEQILIVDPSCDFRNIEKIVNHQKVLAVLLTHGHYDHFRTLEQVLNKYHVNCYLHKEAKSKIFDLESSYAKMFGAYTIPKINQEQLINLSDGEILTLGDFKIKVVFTLGHTNCSVCYIINEMVFTGDTIFKLSVGRTDLLTGSAIKQIETINRFKKIKTDYLLYPGHDDSTTLFFEQKNNPYFK